MKAVKQRVADRDIRDLLWQFLRAGVMEQGKRSETLTGTPPGGIVSPLAANIYLHTFDRYMESNYLNLAHHHREKRRKQGKGNFLSVRYCDDFVVLCNGPQTAAYQMQEEISKVLNQMGLTLSETKTQVTHITAGFAFRGYRVIRKTGPNGKRVPKVLIPEHAIKKLQHKMRAILAPNTVSESVKGKIQAQNGLTRGWCAYYRSTSSPAVIFSKLEHALYWFMAHWLGRKYKLRIPAVMQRFQQGNTFRTRTIQLIMPSEYKAKRFVAKTWHNPYTEKEQVKEERERMKRDHLFSYDKVSRV